jgi:rod shape-determining protein MreC
MKKLSPRFWIVLAIVIGVVGLIVLSLSGYLSLIIGKAASPIIGVESWIATRYVAFRDFLTVPRDVNTLRQQNAALENEVSQLESQVLELEQQLSETQILYALLDYARTAPENKYVAASVIGKDPSPFMSYIIIDHGSDDGILYGMPVVTQQGLVGKVVAVTATAARVQLITDANSVVNITLTDAGVSGQVGGSVTGDLALEMVSSSAEVLEGDIVLTSGLGGSFPSDIMVGQILSPSKSENDLYYSAIVQPAVDFNSLDAVLVITNFKPVDITPLTSENG